MQANVSFDEGATLEPLATSLHGVGLANPQPGETVVIQGAGIIGLGCVQASKTMVPCRVIVVDASARRLELAHRFGADATVNLTETDPLETVLALPGDSTSTTSSGAVWRCPAWSNWQSKARRAWR